MMLGLTNAPAIFQTMMNNIFWDLISDRVICVYIDNILIYTKDLETHQKIAKKVLWHLQKHRLCLKYNKCEFEKTQIEYLGLIIGEEIVEMDPVKIAGVMDWPVPT